MNAVTGSANDFIRDNTGGGSDSDTNTNDSPEYYQPISTEADDEELELADQQNSSSNSDEDDQFNTHHSLPNGYASCVENGVSSLDLSADEDDDTEKEEEEESNAAAVQRAFREDESRRSAPLTPQNATRVMEAMREISFGGLPPDWAGRIPEDQWINQLRRTRQHPPAADSAAQD